MLKIASSLAMLLAAAISSYGASGQLETSEVFTLPADATAAASWQNPMPEVLAISYEPNADEAGNGAVKIKVLKRHDGIVELKSPAFELKSQNNFVTARRLKWDMQAKAAGFLDGAVQFRIRHNAGAWAVAVRPRRDWDTVIDMTRIHEWLKWGAQSERGTIRNNTTRASLSILVNTSSGKGEIWLNQVKISEERVSNHLFRTERPDRVFFGESGKVAIDYFDPEHLLGGAIVITDEKKRKLREIPLNPGVRSSEIKLPKRGFYEITVTGNYPGGKTLSSSISAGVIGPRIDEAVRRQSRYGIMRVHAGGDWFKEAGFNVDWGFWTLDGVKPQPDGSFRYEAPAWKRPDGITYIAGMTGTMPTWLRSEKCRGWELMPPRDWDMLAKAVECWVKNDRNLPDIFTIYNEPDAHWRGNEEDFIKFHNVITDAIKKADPSQKVGGPCMYGIRLNDFNRYVDKGILKGMDCVVMHAYVKSTAPEYEFIENIIGMQQSLQKRGYGHLPVYLTEFGWTSPPGDWQKPIDELSKARYAVRSLILCTARDIAGLIYFNARYSQLSDQYSYSVVKPDYSPLPAYVGLATFLREFSTIKGGGHYLKLAPEVYWAGFKRDGNTLAAVWTQHEKNDWQLPATPKLVREMTGALREIQSRQTLDPSPLYLEFPGLALSEIAVSADKTTLLPGAVLTLPEKSKVTVPPGLKLLDGNRIAIPEKVVCGEYTVIYELDGKYHARVLEVISPLNLAFAGTDWDGRSDRLKVNFNAATLVPSGVTASGRFNQTETPPLPVKPAVDNLLGFELGDIVNGRRYRGRLEIAIDKPIHWQTAATYDITPLAVPYYTATPKAPIWDKLAPIDLNSWQQPGEFDQPAPVKGSFKGYAAPDGFHLQVTVEDENHLCDELWSDMWKHDSIQFGFDLDKDSPWQYNNVGHGLNGHRVVQYGLGMRPGKTPMGWCFTAYIDNVKSGPAFELMKHSTVVREGKRTIYEARIPWPLLGLEHMPPPDRSFGFALLINNADQKQSRTMMRYFDGIANGNPELYGRMMFVKK